MPLKRKSPVCGGAIPNKCIIDITPKTLEKAILEVRHG